MNLQGTLSEGVHYLRYLLNRIKHDRINVSAGYLAYISVISIVPLLTVLLSVLSSISAFSQVGATIQDFVIANFVPAAGAEVSSALHEFIANTAQMTVVGSGILFIAAIALIANIDKSLNFIWRVKRKRRAVFSFSMYWMVLTLGPILVGASIAITSYVASLRIIDSDTLNGAYNLTLRWLPFLLSLFTFVGLYILVPNLKVRIRHALVGALVAALLFELSKKLFTLYITHFPSYQLIYGALAAIPILFIWIYLSWLIVLLGAEVTAALGERACWSLITNVVDSNKLDIKEEQISDCPDTKSQ
ncbi:virulence factor BrkB family protein [Vibrio profundum]|uniref:virulence factor BrkB family protein n=1 Tax=Vibrio profundum TaxID=2910247 RepID=UPI003D0F56D7